MVRDPRSIRCAAVALVLLAPAGLAAQASNGSHGDDRPSVEGRVATEPVVLDGRLDDAAWASVPAATSFRQWEPNSGAPATQQTEVRFVFDEEALWIGARMYDSLGAAGVRTRLERRDHINEGDYLQLYFDTFHDHTGRTILMVNPSGVKYDAGQAAVFVDESWDPVWQVATTIDSLGWTAELRIPWSQLRFARDSDTWGLQVWRFVERLNETSMWTWWGKDDPGGPQRFGHLNGVRPGSARGFEVLPYAVTRAQYARPSSPDDPFQDESDYGVRLGGDVKAVLGSALTLDLTVNPDFGQVEVDPAVVNLSAFETFFEERRPFFVEGSGLFGFGGLNCYFCSNTSSLSLFYSRRIGRSPQGGVTQDADYVDAPSNTTILGAAKVTGRTVGGWQIGVLDAVTASERADAQSPLGAEFDEEVEPLTNYFVGRVKRNYRGGNLTLGAIGTSVARRFDSDALADLLPSHAEAVGFDWDASWKEQTYNFMGSMALSQVSGDADAILRLQRSSARYFQRPDRQHGDNSVFTDAFDPTLTSMRGLAAYGRFAKEAGAYVGDAQLSVRTPGFENNDVAFLTRADYIWMNSTIMRRWSEPTRWYRRADFMIGAQQQYNFDGDLIDRQFHTWGGGQAPNYWWFSGFYMYRPETFDDRLTRGGPVVRKSSQHYMALNVDTDYRKAIAFYFGPSIGWKEDGGNEQNVYVSMRYKPASNVVITLGPSWRHFVSDVQFVDRFSDPARSDFFGQRVLFADLEQYTVAMDTRISATFTPTLTLEVFAQPFVSAGRYDDYKEFAVPRSIDKIHYDAQNVSCADDCLLDADGDPATTGDRFSFRNLDFNTRSLRGNAVLRWEYRPGSTLYLVWQQERSGAGPDPRFDFGRDTRGIFRERPQNIFLVKLSYWFGV